MPRTPKPPPDDPEQSKRFIDMAREVEADEGEAGRKAFERTFKGVIAGKPKVPKRAAGRSRRSEKPVSS
jgi:hypothetical protein